MEPKTQRKNPGSALRIVYNYAISLKANLLNNWGKLLLLRLSLPSVSYNSIPIVQTEAKFSM